jgi:DNA helicase IV
MALEPAEEKIVAEEEALLSRTQAAIERAVVAQRDLVLEARRLEALREEAQSVAADDLPSVLHDLAVEHRLAQRPERALPDRDAPYLAHFQLEEGGKKRDYLLGRTTWLDGDVRIVDWRAAPVARIFYAHREGDEYEAELPGRTACGTLSMRRLVSVDRGRLVRIQTADRTLVRDEEGWRSIEHGPTSGGSGAAIRDLAEDVTASLDRDQWAAIEAEGDLLVLGSAGSGKTTVALHRIARLGEGEVVVPEEGLARLSRRLLSPLGSSARVRTLDRWAEDSVRDAFEERVPIASDTPALVVALKRHPATFDAIMQRIRPDRRFRRLRARLHELFTDATFLASLGHSRAAIDDTVRHTRLQMMEPASRALASVTDRAAKRAIDGRGVVADTPDELGGTVDREDLPILLALHPDLPTDRMHLVVDEAEDASLFELDVLGRTLDGHVTLAGDEAQQTTSSFAGWQRALSTMRIDRAETVRLATSYRCPRPIAELARAVLGQLAPEVAPKIVRDGPDVERQVFPRAEEAFLFAVDAAARLARDEPRASIAILARDPETAARIHALFDRDDGARLVEDGAFELSPGIDVADVDSAKGLEFDTVILPDATDAAYPPSDEARRRLHVAVTRAAYRLSIVGYGKVSDLAFSPLPCAR